MVEIGNWVRREGAPTAALMKPKHKWHRVESVVAGDVITRCGRRMDRETGKGAKLEVNATEPLTRLIGQPQNCRRCS